MINLDYYIGVDGGGTKTRIVLLDKDLKLQAEKEIEASNLVITDSAEILNKLNKILKGYLDQYNVQGIGLGMAGIDTEQDRIKFEQKMATNYPGIKVRVCNDGVASLIGGLNYRSGILINAGTGSIAVGVDRKGNIYRAGGWDYLLGDEGSGYWIGKKLIQAAIDDHDYGYVDTNIIRVVKQFFQITTLKELIDIIYNKNTNKDIIARLAQETTELALNGDIRAKRIYERAGKELAKLVIKVYHRGKFDIPVSLTYNGSIFKSFSLFKETFFKYLGERQVIFNWQTPIYPAEIGAVLMVMRGREMGANFCEVKL